MREFPLWLTAVVYGIATIFIFRLFIFGGDMLYGGDTEALGYMARAFYADQLSAGNFPMWNPLLLGGTPFLGSLAGGDSLYPLSAPLFLLMEPFRALGWKLVIHVLLAGFAMYGWTRAIGVSKPAAFVAGLGYLVAPYFVTLVFPAHDGKMFVTALTPLLFWAVESFFVSGRGRCWAATAGVVALVILTTHFQMAYFLFLATGAYAAFRMFQLIRDPAPMLTEGRPTPARAAGRFGLFLVASLVGAGSAGVQLVPALGYIGSDSRRTATTTEASDEVNRAYAASFSLHPEEIGSLIVPEFIGNTGNLIPGSGEASGGADWTLGTYWGRNGIKLNHEYIGLALMILAGLSFFGAPRRGLRIFMLSLFSVTLLYALGAHTPVWGIAYAILPGIDLFRAASMIIFLSGFAIITLAAFGVDLMLAWARGEAEASRGASRWLVGTTAFLCLILLLAGSDALFSLWNSILYSDIGENQLATLERLKLYIVRGSLSGLIVAGATLGVGFAAKSGRMGVAGVVGALALLIAVDGIRVDVPFVQTRPFEGLTRSDPLIDNLVARQGEETPFRVLDFGDDRGEAVRGAMFGLELSSGHHPNDLARYRELIGKEGSQPPINLLTSSNIRRITNTRYLIWPTRSRGDLTQYQGFEDAVALTASQLQDGTIYETLYQFPDLPRARLVGNAVNAEGQAAVDMLLDPTFDVETTVVSADIPSISLGGGQPDGSVNFLERETNRSTMEVVTDRAALVVLSDNWVGAWKARVNGEAAEVLRVNHTFMAVAVPAGSHTVEVVFESVWVAMGLWITVVCLILMAVVTMVSFVRLRRPVLRPAEEGFAVAR